MGRDRLSHEGRDSPLRVARRSRLGEGVACRHPGTCLKPWGALAPFSALGVQGDWLMRMGGAVTLEEVDFKYGLSAFRLNAAKIYGASAARVGIAPCRVGAGTGAGPGCGKRRQSPVATWTCPFFKRHICYPITHPDPQKTLGPLMGT